MVYFSFFFIPLFVENHRINQFFINFDKDSSFLIINKFLFILIYFLSVLIVFTMVTNHALVCYGLI